MSEKKIVYINEEDIQESNSSGKKLTDYDPEMQKLILDFVEHTNINPNSNMDKLFEQMIIEEGYCREEDEDTLYVFSEEAKKNYTKNELSNYNHFNNDRLEAFCIYDGFFPYSDMVDTYSIRPVLAVPVEIESDMRIKFKLCMITHAKKSKNKPHSYYDYHIEDNKQARLDNQSYIRTCIMHDVDRVLNNEQREYGFLSGKDIKLFRIRREQFEAQAFTHPFAFMYWLIENRVKDTTTITGGRNNNDNPIQTVEDIAKSLEANCVDIAIVSYKMVINRFGNKNATIALVDWIIDQNHSAGYTFMLFKYNNYIYVFDYDQDHQVGRFVEYNKKSFKEVAIKFSYMIKQLHPNIKVHNYKTRQVIRLMNKEELELLNNTDSFKSQNEFLDIVQPVKIMRRENNDRILNDHCDNLRLSKYIKETL